MKKEEKKKIEKERKGDQSSRRQRSCKTCPSKSWPAAVRPCWEQSIGRNLGVQRVVRDVELPFFLFFQKITITQVAFKVLHELH